MKNISPLRYPGGKSRLVDFFKLSIHNLKIKNCVYVEPFAGGAGVACSLLLDNVVDKIVINDYDRAIYSFWRAVKDDSQALIEKIKSTEVSIEEWRKQKQIYLYSTSYSVDLAFATLFLNRTNRSGILNAGPIGGYSQAGMWKLDVRFDKVALIEKISALAKEGQRIEIYNQEIIDFLQKTVKQIPGNLFFYFDPPYYNKGQKLYANFLTPMDHQRIHDVIVDNIPFPWIMTYDDVESIEEIYKNFKIKKFDLTYSAANKGRASELMIFSDWKCCPSDSQLRLNRININLRG